MPFLWRILEIGTLQDRDNPYSVSPQTTLCAISFGFYYGCPYDYFYLSLFPYQMEGDCPVSEGQAIEDELMVMGCISVYYVINDCLSQSSQRMLMVCIMCIYYALYINITMRVWVWIIAMVLTMTSAETVINQFTLTQILPSPTAAACVGTYWLDNNRWINGKNVYMGWSINRFVAWMNTNWIIASTTDLPSLFPTSASNNISLGFGSYSGTIFNSTNSNPNIDLSTWNALYLTVTLSNVNMILVGVSLQLLPASSESNGTAAGSYMFITQQSNNPLLFNAATSTGIARTSSGWAITSSAEIGNIFALDELQNITNRMYQSANRNGSIIYAVWPIYKSTPIYIPVSSS